MPAVPKRRGSASRRDRRRSHDSLKKMTNIVLDKESGEYRLNHHIDATTGKYNGRKVKEVKA
jgi:large subunit ribosomal protein L32